MQIDRIEVPGPEQVGECNLYLLRGKKTVLIDTGPGREETFRKLTEDLEKLGTSVERIDLIIVTHSHSDHFGNARRIKELADAEIASHRDAAEVISGYEEYLDRQNNLFEDYFARNGVPEEENNKLLKKAVPDNEGVSVEVDRRLEDGDELAGIEVIYTPGHTRGSICLRLDDECFVGDTVLQDITPNPMLYIEEGHETGTSLENYLKSLEKLRKEEFSRLYPGHEEVIQNPTTRISEIIDHHEERAEEVLEILQSPKTAYKVMKELFGDLEPEIYLFAMSEAIGHLELLRSRGQIERIQQDGRVFFQVC